MFSSTTTPTLQGVGDTLFGQPTTFTRRVRHLSRRPKPDAVGDVPLVELYASPGAGHG
jgi:hypothetical protein